jgi:cobalt-zinc-cadmium efflux system outer membrane protein
MLAALAPPAHAGETSKPAGAIRRDGGTRSAMPAHARETLKLSGLLSEARAKNPTLSAMQYKYEAGRERVPQAGALPDPMLMMGVQNLPTNSFSFSQDMMTSKMIGLSQTFPFFGKRGLKRETAAYEAQALEGDYKEVGLQLEKDVKTAYFDLYLLKKSQEVLDKTANLLDSLLKITQSRYSVGLGNFKDIIKTQVEQSLLVDKRLSLERDERTKRAELGALLGRGAPVTGEVEDVKPAVLLLDAKALSESAVADRPALKAASERIKEGEAMVETAKKDYYPDFTITAQYMERDRQDTGVSPSDMISAVVSVNLPIWRKSKLDPAVLEASLAKNEAEQERDAKVNEIKAQVQSLVEQVNKDGATIKLYREVVIPQAGEDINAGLAGYEVGKVQYIDLLDSIRTFLDYQTEYYNRIARREKAIAELEAVTGKELEADPAGGGGTSK